MGVLAGRMNITNHESVLSALVHRASRYTTRGPIRGVDENLVSWAIDETGTIDTSFLCNNNENNEQIVLAELQERNMVLNLSIPEEVLRIHGTAPISKPEGVIWLIYENANGISNRMSNNEKVEKAKEIMNDFEVTIIAYNEHLLNMRDRQTMNGFGRLFNGGEATIHALVAHNVW